jgi:plastocyanin
MKPLLLLALLATACGGTTQTQGGGTGDSPSTPAEPECAATTVLEMDDNLFDPTCLEVTAEQSLTLRNVGAALHNLQVENVDLDVDVPAGEEANTEPVGQVVESGTYRFICKYHPGQMIGELRVA